MKPPEEIKNCFCKVEYGGVKMKRLECFGIVILLNLSLWVFGSFLSRTAFAASADFPTKEITIIVNYAPGGAGDIIARGVGKTMSKYLGVPMVIMNMPGAGGARGLISLYHSAPDGYTIGTGTPSDIIRQVVEKTNYDSKKFTYIGNAQASPSFLFVKPDSPFRSVKDFKAFGKPLRYSTFNLTSATAVATMVLANREGFPLLIVGGYQGSSASILALIRGEVEFTGSLLSSATPFLQDKLMRPILTIYPHRYPGFLDILTVRELGYPDLEGLGNNYWFIAPPGVPKARIKILEDSLMKTLKDREFLEWAKKAGVDLGPMSGEELKKKVFNLFGFLEQYKGDIGKYIKK